MATGNEELEQFKSQINLCDYAAAQGFELDRKQSSKSSAVMRHSCGDKIVVARKPSGHWIYFNVHGNDSGSIIDFVAAQNKSLSLGLIRKELRPWVTGGGGCGSVVSRERSNTRQHHDLIPSVHSFDAVNLSWARSRSLLPSDQYLECRGIPNLTSNAPIFADRIRIDERNNCIFPHWNASGAICGFEIKNVGFTGFSPGGKKGLWCSRAKVSDNTMVVCESAIDALSIAAIFGYKQKRFFSTAGTCSPGQTANLVSAANRMPPRAEIWLALDNDDAGRDTARILHEAITKLSGSLSIVEKLPEQAGFDWNDVLRQSQSSNKAQEARPSFRR